MIETPFKPIQIYSNVVDNIDNATKNYREIIKDFKSKDLIEEVEPQQMWTDYYADESSCEYRMKTWSSFCEHYLGDSIDEFAKANDLTSLHIKEIWTQITKGGGTHHPHTHGDVGWSFVWYIDIDEKEHKPTFYYNSNPPYNSWAPKLEKGKLLIWPSWLLHYQPPSNSDIDRCIISGNIRVY